jgi:DNA-binding HxlR family transcriptional regulator
LNNSTDNLWKIENGDLLTRAVFAEVPPRVEYSLSDLGNSMRPIISDMEGWGKKYREIVLKG